MAGIKSVRLMILGDNKDAAAKIDEIQAKADEMATEHPELKMGIDSAAAAEKLRILREDLRSTTRDAKDLKKQFAEIDFAKLGVGSAWLAGIAAAAGPLPVLLGSVAGGVAGIAAAVTPAVAGVGLFALVAKSSYSQVSGAVQQYDKAMSTSGKARETALKSYRAQLAALSPSQRAFASSIEKVTAAWQGFVGHNQAGVTSVLNKGLGVLPGLLTALQPLLAPTEQALKSIIGELGKGIKSSGFKSFIHDLAAFAGPAIMTLAGILGHLGHMAGKAIQAFMPLGTILLRDINGILSKADSGTNNAIQKFLGWIGRNGPEVIGIVKRLGGAIVNIAKAFGRMGGIDIGAFSAIAGLIAAIASHPIGADVIAGLLVLWKVGPMIGPLVGLVKAFMALREAIGLAKLATMAFMGVGLIAVIALLVTGIVLLIEHWKTVKRVTLEVWHAVEHAVMVAAHWIAHTFDGIRHSIASFVMGMAHDVRHWFDVARHDIMNAIDVALHWVESHWPLLLGILTGPIGLAVGFIVTHFHEIESGAARMFHNVVGFFTSMPGRILGALGNVGSLLWNAGSAIIHSLLGGLLSAWHSVTSFVGGIASWISSHKGPITVDAVLLYPHGKAIMGGLVAGLQAGMPNLTSQLTRTTNVIANMKTPSILAASGNRSHLTAEWVGGEGADAEFITWLKQSIRIRGGDPELLGR